jgi:thiamine kinase-like enzyme
MNPPQSGMFQYIKVPGENKRLFCLQQNIGVLAWMLFFVKDSLTPIVRSDSKTSRIRSFFNQMRSYPGLVKKNVRFLGIFIRYKLQLLKSEVVVELPCYGQVCVPIHKGYKVFDFHREVVIKVFDHDVNDSIIRDEIELLQLVSLIEFSSSLKKWSIEERWYEEEYVNGILDSSYKAMDSGPLLQKFFNEVVQHLTSLMLFQEPKSKNSLEYVLDIIRTFSSKKFSMQARTEAEVQEITSFIDSIVSRLRGKGSYSIFFVFAHGDFVPANMLNVGHGVKIIDWEGAGPKSALFDFYSYFFYRPACRKVPVDLLVSEINEALPMLISKLEKNAVEFSNSLKILENSYRWTFYIEMICRLVDREMTDKNLNVMPYIREYIRAFKLYEVLQAGKGQ